MVEYKPLESVIKEFEQAVPAVIIKVRGKQPFLADGGTRSKVYGMQLKTITKEFDSWTKAFEFWKGIVSHNPRATREEKVEKITRLAEILRTVMKFRPGEISGVLSELLAISEAKLGKYLPDRYKMMSHSIKKKRVRRFDNFWLSKSETEFEDVTSPKVEKLSNTEMTDRLINWLYEKPELSEELPKLRLLRDLLIELLPKEGVSNAALE